MDRCIKLCFYFSTKILKNREQLRMMLHEKDLCTLRIAIDENEKIMETQKGIDLDPKHLCDKKGRTLCLVIDSTRK